MPKINEQQVNLNKQEILKVALDLFKETSYSQISLNQIIKATGYSKGRFYTYYDSKEALFFDVIYGVDQVIRPKPDCFDSIGSYLSFRLSRFKEAKARLKAKHMLDFWTSCQLSKDQELLRDQRYKGFKEDIRSILVGAYQVDPGTLDNLIEVIMALVDGLIYHDCVLNQVITDDKISLCSHMIDLYLKEESNGN